MEWTSSVTMVTNNLAKRLIKTLSHTITSAHILARYLFINYVEELKS